MVVSPIRCTDSVLCICEYIMQELTELERGQNFGARLAGASVNKVAEVFGASGGTLS